MERIFCHRLLNSASRLYWFSMPFTVIFIGPQGSGKGTQGHLLQEKLAERFGEENSLYFTTGDGFRELIGSDTYTANVAKDSIEKGNLQPEFLAVWLWSREFVKKMHKDAHVITDGFPRQVSETRVLDGAFDFYGRAKRIVFSLEISDESSVERMLKRARHDDTEEGIKERLRQYHEQTKPILDLFRKSEDYEVIDIDGEQTIEEVHQSIMEHIDSWKHD